MSSKNNTSFTITLNTDVSLLRGIGPKRGEALHDAGLHTVTDLLRLQPRRYEDRTRIRPLRELRAERLMQGPFRGVVKSFRGSRPRAGLSIVWAEFDDGTAVVRARWFNRPYLVKSLVAGKAYYLYGTAVEMKGAPILDNPELELEDPAEAAPVPGALTPVYSAGKAFSEAKLSGRQIRQLIARTLAAIDWAASFPNLLETGPFPRLRRAFFDFHWPRTQEAADHARHTAAFFDQVLFQMAVWERRKRVTGILGPDPAALSTPLPAEPGYPIPFRLTGDQSLVLGKMLAGLRQGAGCPPLNLLLQGDVGSGKTLVAFLAMRHHAERHEPGTTCVFMAPTEILARQHLERFRSFFPDAATDADLLVGALRPQDRRNLLAQLSDGRLRYVFGTHALFQDAVVVPNLSFCVIDEQQRFGVDHRRALTAKAGARTPHLLLMSATPIPRTLSLTIYGDLDVGIIREMPPGRKPVATHLLGSPEDALPYIREAVSRREQVYYVCPLIETSKKIAATSVREAVERLRFALPEAAVAAVTGDLASERRQAAMEAFHAGNIDVLVATTVIEVGVDAPAATLMVVENAERFGLSQLHQLRGRVGRGERPSSCLLISADGEANERLRLVAGTTDGFELAAEDLRLRGPGDLAGTRQSGIAHPAFSHRMTPELIEKARNRALELLTVEPGETRDWFTARMRESFGNRLETFMEGG
ncbi:ATP-dependent DNA helicase RecG [Candidatus Ozemobacteraceae bacterium]|nr:ATP-dependent DNA helicase RecG [Candidatus Ozemobacteraceae bacterium]